jgi:hypothetical protein
MDVYILDGLGRRQTVIDVYESLIWTERYAAYGDFELVVYSTAANRLRFAIGQWLVLDTTFSVRVMMLETIQNSVDTQGNMTLTIKGRSIEALLDSRVVRATMSNTTTEPKWVTTGTPSNIAIQIFHNICVAGTLDPNDVIPNIVEASSFTSDMIQPPATSITYEIPPKSLYAALTDICGIYLLGFQLTRPNESLSLFYEVYTGRDRTTRQTNFNAVVFSPDLDNLQGTTELTSISAYKNVAYVISPVGVQTVYAPGTSSSITGFARQVMVVNATDINDTDPTVAATKLQQRGLQELGKNRQTYAFDGQLSQNSQYVYGIDYNLGDLVELRNSDGVISEMLVTEQIFVSDKQGVRSYPTLSVYQFVMPGTWFAVPPTQDWADLPDTDHWADNP